jgi:hypothetical protein
MQAKARARGSNMTSSRAIRWYDIGGSVLWIAMFCVIIVLAMMNPDARSVTPAYRLGTERFLSGLPLYNLDVSAGYLYSPAFAALFVPFYELGAHLGDLLWRFGGFAALTYAAVRQVRLIGDDKPLWLLSCGLFLAAPLCSGALRNGQATILLTGACWLLTLAALDRKPMQTFVWAAVALAAKPTAIVVILLVGAVRPRLIPVLLLAILALFALPYAFAPYGYVTEQSRSFFALITGMSLDKPQYFTPADFTAPFTALGFSIPALVASGIRAVAALLTLTAVIWFDRNGERRTAGLAIFVLAAWYMSVFNPRVEGNTYALLAVPFGLSIALMFREGATVLAVLLGTLLFASGFTGVEPHVHRIVNLWFQPVVSSVIFVGIVWWHRARLRPLSATLT